MQYSIDVLIRRLIYPVENALVDRGRRSRSGDNCPTLKLLLQDPHPALMNAPLLWPRQR
jgi:hypothetical protein